MNTPKPNTKPDSEDTCGHLPRLVRPVLILASYCSGEDEPCSDEYPCAECLQMCNIALIEKDAIKPPAGMVGQFDINRDEGTKYLPND